MWSSKTFALLFFAAYLLLGLLIFDDYSITTDEPVQRDYGLSVAEYVGTGNADTMLTLGHLRYYGPVFEVLLVLFEKMLHLEDLRSIFLLRHFLTFLLFFGSTIAFYALCMRRFCSRSLAFLGCLLLILHPGIFGHSFFNSKDLPFLALSILSILTLLHYLEKKTPARAALHALTSALLIDTRILGIIMPLFTLFFVSFELLRQPVDREHVPKMQRALKSFLLYCGLLIALTILFWPFLWRDPLQHFVEALWIMRKYPHDTSFLYLGKFVNPWEIPWHYAPLWIFISTPLTYSAFFLIGTVVTLSSLAKQRHLLSLQNQHDVLVLLWFFLPLLAVVLLRSSLYNGWRQLFFLYPAFVLLALRGLERCFASHTIRTWAALVLLLSILSTSLTMIRNHPYEYVYFNALVGGVRGAQGRFELDYWELAYREALAYILAQEKSDPIRVHAPTRLGALAASMLLPSPEERLQFVSRNEAQYLLVPRRGTERQPPSSREVYSVDVEGVPIMSVYLEGNDY